MKTTGERSQHRPRRMSASAGAVGPDLERWEIKAASSEVRFTLRHIVVHDIHGRFARWGGSLLFDRATPGLSTVRVWIDLASVDTDSKERDDHVRSAEFFDVARFPRAEFEGTSVEVGRDRVVLRGLLGLHGVWRDVELEVTPASIPTEGLVKNAYRIRGIINRQSFGLHWNQDLDSGGVVVGDEVEIEADVEIGRVADDGP
jgi:polyisoprenoid-binding protein YceI